MPSWGCLCFRPAIKEDEEAGHAGPRPRLSGKSAAAHAKAGTLATQDSAATKSGVIPASSVCVPLGSSCLDESRDGAAPHVLVDARRATPAEDMLERDDDAFGTAVSRQDSFRSLDSFASMQSAASDASFSSAYSAYSAYLGAAEHMSVSDGLTEQQHEGRQVEPARGAREALAPERPQLDPSLASDVDQIASLHKQGPYTLRAGSMLTSLLSRLGPEQQAVLTSELRKRGVELQVILERSALFGSLLRGYRDDSGWRVSYDKGGLRVLYKHTPGSTVHSFKAYSTICAPVENLLALSREFDLVHTWSKYMVDTRILSTATDYELFLYGALWLPWPLHCRDAVVHAVGVDALDEHGCMMVAVESTDALPDGVSVPKEAGQRSRLRVLRGSTMVLRPLARTANGLDVTEVVCTSHMETGIANMPGAVINFVMAVFAPFLYNTALRLLARAFSEPGNPLPSRVRERAAMYDLVRRRVAEAAAKLGDQGAEVQAAQRAARAP